MKLGGSLLNLECLPERLFAAIDDLHSPILVTGGGTAAEQVRKWHRAGWLNEVEAHWQAIAAMSFNASTLVESADRLTLVDSVQQAVLTLQNETVPVLDVFALLKNVEHGDGDRRELPASWDVTSDSIAARLSEVAGGSLRLLKSVAAGPNPAQYLDRYFQFAASHLAHVEWLNMRADEPVVEILECHAWLPAVAPNEPGMHGPDTGFSGIARLASG